MNRESGSRGIGAFHAVMTAHAVLYDRLESELQTAGGPPLSWMEVLALLQQAPDGTARMQELAEHMVLSRSGLTRLVDRMERQGLVERRRCPVDRRGVDLAATDAGRRLYRKSEPLVRAAVDEHVGRHLSGAELDRLEAVLNRLLEANSYSPHEPGIGR